jgi:class 3 adenylate cyclase
MVSTLLGETVTIALRIQELTAELACPILVGECAARHLADHNLQSQGSYLLNGLRIPHTLSAPPQADMAPKSRTGNPALKVLAGGRQ